MKDETELGRQLRKNMTIEGNGGLEDYEIELAINGKHLLTKVVSGCFNSRGIVEGGLKYIGFKKVGKTPLPITDNAVDYRNLAGLISKKAKIIYKTIYTPIIYIGKQSGEFYASIFVYETDSWLLDRERFIP